MQSNMLSEEKVKLHGMRSRRWTDNHKITQYEGIVKLYERDQILNQQDTVIKSRQLKKTIRSLRKNIHDEQEKLSNIRKGDRQKIKNSLTAHKNFMLTFGYYPTSVIIEELVQRSFKKRKELDRLNFEINKDTEELISLNLGYAKLEDTIKYEKEVPFPDDEEQTRILTSKVQEYIIKKDAAVIICETYSKILDILDKDAIYYDAVLAALQVDGHNQSKCILQIIVMGQLAAEYVDDKKDQIAVLEKAIKKTMAEREEILNAMKQVIENVQVNIKKVIQKDNIMEFEEEQLCDISESEKLLLYNLELVKDVLEKVRKASVSATVENILPRLQEQQQQRFRLEELIEKNISDRKILLYKTKQAEEVYRDVCDTMVSTTTWYKAEKTRILDETDQVIKDTDDMEQRVIERGDLYLNLRSSLEHLIELLRNVHVPGMADIDVQKKKDMQMEDPDSDLLETYSDELLALLKAKIVTLMDIAGPEIVDESAKRVAAKIYQSFISDMLGPTRICATPRHKASLIDEINIEDPTVPDRDRIKAKSEEICTINARSEFDVPVLTVKKS